MKKLILITLVVMMNASSLALPISKLYWTDRNIGIQRSNVDGSGIEDMVTTGVNDSWGIAIDDDAGKMYWTNRDTDTITVANLDGSNVLNLFSAGTDVSNGIALDSNNGKMYWTAFGEGTGVGSIQSANMDGTGGVDNILSNLLRPSRIAIDSAGGMMYWTDFGTGDWGTGGIYRANLDGSQSEKLPVDFPPLSSSSPGGIALDVEAGQMYWTEASRVRRANLDGSNAEELLSGLNYTSDIALDLAIGKMYITDFAENAIYSANLDGSGFEYLINVGLDDPTGIALSVVPEPATLCLFGLGIVGLCRRRRR